MKEDLHLHRSLKELEDYRSIGSIEEFKSLKQIGEAKKPVIRVYPQSGFKRNHCPNCDANLTSSGFDWCIECGQKLDWSE